MIHYPLRFGFAVNSPDNTYYKNTSLWCALTSIIIFSAFPNNILLHFFEIIFYHMVPSNKEQSFTRPQNIATIEP